MNRNQPTRAPGERVAVLAEDATPCPVCDLPMLTGHRIVIATPCRHETCPPRWKPTVIHGDGRGDAQPQLPLLTLIDGHNQ